MAIGSIDTNTPQGTAPVSEGDNQIVGIKVDVTESFPAFSNSPVGDDIVLGKTGPQIADGAEKSAAETVGGAWTFAGVPRTENNIAWTGRFTGGGNVDLAQVNTNNEAEFGNGGTPGRFKSTMTAEGAWTFEQDIRIKNNQFIVAEDAGTIGRALLGINGADSVVFGDSTLVLATQFSRLFNNNIEQPTSNYCLSVTNGSTTISDGSGGTSGWSVTVLTGVTIRINHAIGTAAYIVALGPTDSANKAIVLSKGATDFVLSFDTSNPSPVDVMVMVP